MGANIVEDFLQHYGKIGMRWGKRSSGKGSSSGSKKKSSHPSSADHLEKVQLKKKKLHTMSNVEVEKLNKRLQLEKQYKELNKSTLSTGKKLVGSLLLAAAKQSASGYIASGLSSGIKILAK